MSAGGASAVNPPWVNPPAGREGFYFGGRAIRPALALFLLAPLVAELCLGSTPLLLYFIPPILLLNLGLYGCGVLVVRELVVRWGRGWPSVLALGVAYAIVEEGLALLTMLDERTGPRVDARLGSYGAGPDGANWVWIATLCAYHAIFSIALPILLVQLAYPGQARRPWLRGRAVALAAAGLLLTVMAARGLVHLGTNADISDAQQGDSILVCLALAFLAWRLPVRIGRADGTGSPPSPRRVWLTVFAATVVFFVGFAWGGKGFGWPAGVTIAAIVAIPVGVAFWLARVSARPGWSDRHRFAVAAGLLSFDVLIAPIFDLAAFRLQIVVGVALALALRRAWAHFRTAEPAVGAAIATGT